MIGSIGEQTGISIQDMASRRASASEADASGPSRPKGPPPSKEDMFAALDKDANGSISESELSDLLKHIADDSGQSLDTTEVLKQLDADGDGALNQEEMEGLKDIIGPPKPPKGFEMKNGVTPETATDRYTLSALLEDDTENTSSLEI
jgi:hypothetical protein